MRRRLVWLIAISVVACGEPAGDACTSDVECLPPRETCVDGRCAPDALRDAGRDAGCTTDCGGRDAGCTPDCSGRECGPDPICGTSCGSCDEPGYCNEHTGTCASTTSYCASSGAPMTAFSEEAVSVATNALIWPAIIGVDPEVVWDDLERIGPHYVQLGVGWNELEAVRGTRDWARYDALFAEPRARGLTPIVILGAPPAWAMVPSSIEPRVDVALWREFVSSVVLRYGSRGMGLVRDFQFFNEPNGSFLGTGTQAHYLELLSATGEVVHATDPEARVWGPAIGCHAYGYDGWPDAIDTSVPLQWLDAALSTDAIDVVSVHLYYHELPRMVDVFRRMVARVSRYRDGQVPIVVNEFNTDDYCRQGGASEDEHARFVMEYYGCLFANGADSALVFEATDHLTPSDPASRPPGCDTFEYYPLGLRSHDGHARSVYYALEDLERHVTAHREARARIEAVPSPCVIAAGASTCSTTLVFARRTETLALAVRTRTELVACLPPEESFGSVAVDVGATPERFDVYAVSDCSGVPAGAPLDSVFVAGTATTRTTGAALFPIDGPCAIAPGARGCATTLAWWTEGIDTAIYPNVQIRMGTSIWRCVPANTFGAARADGMGDPWITNHRFRLYEAASCDPAAATGRLLAATRAIGR